MKKVGQPTLVMTKIQNYKKDEAVKKAGQSTLVIKHKKSAKSIKKAGSHTMGKTLLQKLLVIIILMNNSSHLYIALHGHQSTHPYLCTQPPAWPDKKPEKSINSHTPPVLSLFSGVQWNYPGISNNKLLKIVNGNGRQGYNLGMWNCRRGLVTGNREASTKIVEVKNFIHTKNLHMLCLIEADLHGPSSRYKRVNPLSTNDIKKNLEIPGYKIFLPNSWNIHGQARILVYAKEELKVSELKSGNQVSDLPSITFEISLGKEKKTLVNFFYREFTGGVSGLRDVQAQNERLDRQTSHWRHLSRSNRDFVCLGDANLCAMQWHMEDFNHKEQAEMVHSFLLDTASTQLVREYTRSEIIQGGELSRSCIDHCYSNVPEKLSKPEVVAVGDSDHLGVVVTKFTRAPKLQPRSITKRSYKYFNVEHFLTEVLNSSINKDVTDSDNLEDAAEIFETTFRNILDKHAHIKTFQMRRHYSPYVSDRTKLLMLDRNALKEQAIENCDKTLEKDVKKKGREIKKALAKDEKEYYAKDLNASLETSAAWNTAISILGINNNLSPTVIKHTDEEGNMEMITNPQKLSNMFNHYFRKKVELLRQKTDSPPAIPPGDRLRSWLAQRESQPPPFELKMIDTTMFRKIMKKMKAKRVHGVDWIDSYALKTAGPVIEDSLIHLINLSIKGSKFSARWKPQLIFPLHKKKEKDKLENYRPVSHLVQVGKIVEYAVYFQIVEHFVTNDLFHPNHHGSLANHSTATAITQLFDLMLEAADKQELSGVCLLDQSAAYDLMCHKGLKEKLEIYNFNGASVVIPG